MEGGGSDSSVGDSVVVDLVVVVGGDVVVVDPAVVVGLVVVVVVVVVCSSPEQPAWEIAAIAPIVASTSRRLGRLPSSGVSVGGIVPYRVSGIAA